LRVLSSLLVAALLTLSPAASADGRSVSSLGRIEPYNGIIRLAGPSGGGLIAPVIKEMFVAEGDWVEKDQEIARLDAWALRNAELERINAVIRNARSELDRQKNLSQTSATSRSRLEEATMELEVAQADLAAAKARLDLAVVRAPLRAQVLKIHAFPGERVEADGIMELGVTDRMYAVAEVYETDITRVEIGQRARVEAPALAEPLLGTVERVALEVGKMDALGTDPIAKTDARIVEVFVRLDEPGKVAALTNMQVEVEIGI
jgi:HlyD family secretion protein